MSRATKEWTNASCGHTVKVLMTADPDLNIELLKEASRLYCESCQADIRRARQAGTLTLSEFARFMGHGA